MEAPIARTIDTIRADRRSVKPREPRFARKFEIRNSKFEKSQNGKTINPKGALREFFILNFIFFRISSKLEALTLKLVFSYDTSILYPTIKIRRYSEPTDVKRPCFPGNFDRHMCLILIWLVSAVVYELSTHRACKISRDPSHACLVPIECTVRI